MGSPTTESNKTLLISLIVLLSASILVLVGILIYLFVPPDPSESSDPLGETYQLSGKIPVAPDRWTSTTSSRFYLKHPPGITASKITGKDRRILEGIVHEKGEIELALRFSNENTDLFDLVVGDRAELTPQELYQRVRERKGSSDRDSSKFSYRFKEIEQGNREMLLIETFHESELSQIEIWSANQSGDFLWIQTNSSIGEGVDWLLTPDEARTLMQTVRGP